MLSVLFIIYSLLKMGKIASYKDIDKGEDYF